jgi:hypothetical protein
MLIDKKRDTSITAPSYKRKKELQRALDLWDSRRINYSKLIEASQSESATCAAFSGLLMIFPPKKIGCIGEKTIYISIISWQFGPWSPLARAGV